MLEGGGGVRPYRLYVPTAWRPGRRLPLIVVLHGGGADQNLPFEGPRAVGGILQQQAERHGYIVVAPLGDSAIGGNIAYGSTLRRPWPHPTPTVEEERRNALSGALFVQGERDREGTADNRALAEGFRRNGVDSKFLLAPGAGHGDAWFHAMPRMFDYFDRHRCGR